MSDIKERIEQQGKNWANIINLRPGHLKIKPILKTTVLKNERIRLQAEMDIKQMIKEEKLEKEMGMYGHCRQLKLLEEEHQENYELNYRQIIEKIMKIFLFESCFEYRKKQGRNKK